MIEWVEKNIFWFLMLVAGLYIGFDIFRSRKELGRERAKESFNNFLKALKSAKFKHYVFGFLIFLGMFLFVRGFVIVQNDAQECNLWENQWGGFSFYDVDRLPSVDVILDLPGGMVEFEQGRSYNYYNRKFNANGGRPTDLNFVCNFKLDFGRFIKNVRLDYNERGINK